MPLFLYGWPCLLTNVTEKLKTLRQKLSWLSALLFLNYLYLHHSSLLLLHLSEKRLFLLLKASFPSCLVSFIYSVGHSLFSFFQLFPSMTLTTLYLTCSGLPFIGHITSGPLPITTWPSLPHFLHHWMISLFIQDRNLPW